MRTAGIAFFVVTVAAAGCGSSGSETPPPSPARNGGAGGAGSPGAGGSTPPAGTGGSPGVSIDGGAAGAGGAPGAGGAAAGGAAGANPGAGGAGGTPSAGGCGSGTFGVQVVMDVNWPGSVAAQMGTGKIYLWNRTTLDENGNALSGMLQGCGTILPETALTFAGRIAANGMKILIEVPDAVWEAPTMPKFPVKGMASAATPAAMVNLEWASLVGINLPDPKADWPDSYTALAAMAQDADGDGKPGYTALPRNRDGFVLPPTSVGLGGSAPAAEKVHLVSRHLISVAGMRTTCDELSGTANVTAFDSHVMGCSVKGGADCSANQTDFVDQNRMKYRVTAATFKAKKLTSAASCADVRQALPM